ncbi:MAG: hypothetical protein JWM93_3710 [Frankiales bacterium]|nr:hypothetical protein [Frankiales bacterium]
MAIKRTWKLAVLAGLAALGLAVSAYAHPGRSNPPRTTTATTATQAATTQAATTQAATTAPPAVTAAPSVTLTSPPNGSFYTRGSTALVAGRVTTPVDGTVTCTVDWGDQTPPSGPTPATRTGPGTYSCCVVGHIYLRQGTPTITLTAMVDGVPLGADAVAVMVF